MAINRQARIIMYACKDVQPNEILYFDYNSGGKNQYPTEGFQILWNLITYMILVIGAGIAGLSCT